MWFLDLLCFLLNYYSLLVTYLCVKKVAFLFLNTFSLWADVVSAGLAQALGNCGAFSQLVLRQT